MNVNVLYTLVSVLGIIVSGNATDNSTTGNPATTADVSTVTIENPTTLPPGDTTIIPTTTIPTTQKPVECWSASYADTSNVICIMMQANISLVFTQNNKSETININSNSWSSHGTCTNSTGTIVLSDSKQGQLSWTFNRSFDGTTFNVTNIDITYESQNVKSPVDVDWLHNIESTKMYQCKANQTVVDGTTKDNKTSFVLTVNSFKLEAFQNITSLCDFSSSYESCPADSSAVSNLVPIIVGACLGGLIVVVLIAYLIGRRRSRHGYESV